MNLREETRTDFQATPPKDLTARSKYSVGFGSR